MTMTKFDDFPRIELSKEPAGEVMKPVILLCIKNNNVFKYQLFLLSWDTYMILLIESIFT